MSSRPCSSPSLIFGAVHWVNLPYFVLATGVGVVLGVLFVVTESLLAPIALHAVYDFLALQRLVRQYESLPYPDSDSNQDSNSDIGIGLGLC